MLVTNKKYTEDGARLKERLEEFSNQLLANRDLVKSMLLAAEDRIMKNISEVEERIMGNISKIVEDKLLAQRNLRYESDEPFVEIVSESFSAEEGVQLRLDWNSPFITFLKKNGFTGNSDEAIVDSWVASLSRDALPKGTSEFN